MGGRSKTCNAYLGTGLTIIFGEAMKKFARLVLGVAATAALVACGGGGDSASADVVDKYLGGWGGTCSPDSGISVRRVMTFQKASATRTTGSIQWFGYYNTTCSGSGVPVVHESNTTFSFDFVGTKSASGLTVDKGVGSIGGSAARDIFYTDGKTLRTGDGAAGGRDAEGFANALTASTAVKL